MTQTDVASAPAAARPPRRGDLVVMKFGGTSVAGAERLRAVARRLVAARESGSRVVAVLSAMGHTTDELFDLAHEVSPRPHPRELDMLVSVGERVSCALCAMAVIDLGHDAVSLTGSQAGIVTDTVHGRAKIVEVRGGRIHEALDRGAIVLVAGFQGVSTASEVTTLGRGGSDTSAVALAAALGAPTCEIYTDVEGVFTADPRLVPDARRLDVLTFDEMLELASAGATVLNARSVEFARNHGVAIHVRCSFAEGEGTWVTEEADGMLEQALISGVAHTLDEIVVRVEGASPATVLGALAAADVSVDTIVLAGPEIVFSTAAADREAVAEVLAGLGVRWSSSQELGKVSVVGAGMRSHPGVAATMLATLERLGIEPLVVSTSPIRIACHVDRDAVEPAVRALHEAYGLEGEEIAHG